MHSATWKLAGALLRDQHQQVLSCPSSCRSLCCSSCMFIQPCHPVEPSLLTVLHIAVPTAERTSSYADEEAGPRSPLLSAQTSLSRAMSAAVSSEQREKDFLEALDAELAKIIRFYLKKEAEVTAKYQELSMQVQRAEGMQPEQAAGMSAQTVAQGLAHDRVLTSFAHKQLPPRSHVMDGCGMMAWLRCATAQLGLAAGHLHGTVACLRKNVQELHGSLHCSCLCTQVPRGPGAVWLPLHC